jgi:hypothetical protein
MAKKQASPNTTQNLIHTFLKGLNKDSDPSFIQEGMWTHAVNATNNTGEGNVGTISNESSNYLCITAGETMPLNAVNKFIIGAINVFSDNWLIFTAGHNSEGQPVSSEIGLLQEDRCIYLPIVQDSCLGFDKRYLISGAQREKEDCSWQVYFADGLNPDRYINVGDPQTWLTAENYTWLGTQANMNFYSDGQGNQVLWPGVAWKQDCSIVNDCEFCTDLGELDCDKIRLARLMETPCLKVKLGTSGGDLRNGTYFAMIAYSINGQKVTDYFSQSNNQFIFNKNDLEGSLDIEVEADSENFDEFILVVVQNVNQGTIAKQVGFYSTKTTFITLDQIRESNLTVPIENLPIQTPVFTTSDQMVELNNYLLKIGPRTKFDFNYQPLANLIKAKWISTEYPGDYYVKGGNKTGYLRDEVYSFFIRWVYDTGDKSASYHIPGRPPRNFNIPNGSSGVNEVAGLTLDQNDIYGDEKVYEVYNTASIDAAHPLLNTTTDDGGTIIGVGDMGFWQSSEKYPDNTPEIWNSSSQCWTGPEPQISQTWDLCGQPIRHHKFPENFINNNTTDVVSHFKSSTNPDIGTEYFIRIMGVTFENISLPKDNEGKDVQGIVGYEILRGSREGSQTIIAKGIVNNFRDFKIRGSAQKGRTGLYANYPFNTIKPFGHSSTDGDANYQYNDPYIVNYNDDDGDDIRNQNIPTDILSFHSPDTMFRSPFLATQELKIYGWLQGTTEQTFIEPDQHPQFKLLSDLALIPVFLAGITEGLVSFIGKRTISDPEFDSTAGSAIGGPPLVVDPAQIAGVQALTLPIVGPLNAWNTFIDNYGPLANIADAFSGYEALEQAYRLYEEALQLAFVASNGGLKAAVRANSIELPDWYYLPGPFKALGGFNQFLFYFQEGAELALRIIRLAMPYNQYALQQIAHGYYSQMNRRTDFQVNRFAVPESFYLRDNVQEISRYQTNTGEYNSYLINNIKRSSTVVVRTKTGPEYDNLYPEGVNIGPQLLDVDQSLVTIGTLNDNAIPPSFPQGSIPKFSEKKKDISFSLPIASYYTALKSRLRNQYGQLDGITQVVISPCEQQLAKTSTITVGPYTCQTGEQYNLTTLSSPAFYNGDTYINRYTEKNTMFFFNNWLYGQPDGFEYNYLLQKMVPFPRFWTNSKEYDIVEIAPNSLSDIINSGNPGLGTGFLPTDFYNLDNTNYDYENDTPGNYPGLFRAKKSYFYLANSSVKDFFVESEVLVDARQQGGSLGAKHYDPYGYTQLEQLFNMDPAVITAGNTYLYDYSLSVSKLFNQYFPQGNLQNRNYDPNVAELCYTYLPDRVLYSLPQQVESFKDSWFVFLADNYKEFESQISGAKPVGKTGLLMTFKNSSPLLMDGVDQREDYLGVKATIGDGGLFAKTPQNVTLADKTYEYGSSQNRLSVIATPAGIYFISQEQGKVFSYSQQLQEISDAGMKWWFNNFLPYRLTDDFPEYPYKDNPVCGIGCQSAYDSSSSILYFSKRDFKLKQEYKDSVTYVPIITEGKDKGKGDYFTLDKFPGIKLDLGDPLIFEDASWTISYDPKLKIWVSFHDWNPDLFISTNRTFHTTKKNTVWRHNDLCNNFCNFYGEDKFFEIEIPFTSGQTVQTVKSMEYILETYKRTDNNCVDAFHVLDFNFDEAVVYNTEQVSGYLNLNLFPKNNVVLSQQYPKLNNNLSSFDILFSKEEQKYRFNQFWDITKDRGEFPDGSGYPPTGPLVPGTTELLGNYEQQNIWNTEANGYIRTLNPLNLDYTKPLLQRKKFRHYLNYLVLKRKVSGDKNMIVKIINSKNQISQR